MRILPTILMLLAATTLLPAQEPWSRALANDQKSQSKLSDYLLFQDSVIILSSETDHFLCESPRIHALDCKHGKSLWDGVMEGDLLACNDRHIFSVTYYWADVVGYDVISLHKYDNMGNTVFQKSWPELPHDDNFFGRPLSMDISLDSIILVTFSNTSSNFLLRSDTAGKSITRIEPDQDLEFNNCIGLKPDQYLLAGKNNIYLTDSNLVPGDSLKFGDIIQDLKLINDTLYILLPGQFIQVDDELQILDTLISREEGAFQSFHEYGNEFWFQMEHSEQTSLLRLDSTNSTEAFLFDSPLETGGFIIKDDRVVLLGRSLSGQTGAHGGIDINSPGQLTEFPDIGILDYEISNITAQYVSIGDGDSLAIAFWFDVHAQIINSGNSTIESLAVYADLHGGFNCGINEYYGRLIDLGLAPGNSMTVDLGRTYEEVYGFQNLCFQCLAPNSQLEAEVSDNMLCRSIDIVNVEPNLHPAFQVFPNPVTEQLCVRTSTMGITHVVLWDLQGRKRLEEYVTGEEAILDLGSLEDGIYLISLSGPEGIHTQLLLKD